MSYPALTSPLASAMLLAAGRGERMRPLTDTCPKPLLPVQGKPLMQWQLEALTRAGCTRVVVNTAWLGHCIEQKFNDVFKLQSLSNLRNQLLNTEQSINLCYSREGQDFGDALETAGGIARALSLLDEVFWLLAGDVFTPGFEFAPSAMARFAASDKLAHLWLVPNPPHHPVGDFGLQPSPDGSPALALNLPPHSGQLRYTYSTIGLFRRALFQPPWCNIAPGNPQGVKAPLAPLLRLAMDNHLISAEIYTGPWTDVGTPQRLAELNT